jgi:hypothetical protein
MKYVYLGIKAGLARCLDGVHQIPASLALSFNIDGIPIFTSSGRGMWPILGSFQLNSVTRVFPVALTFGKSKPTDLDFLKDFVSELNSVVRSGVEILQQKLEVTLKCMVCDAPAKAFVLGTKLCTGYYGCGKCDQKGAPFKGRVVYPRVDAEPRTDATFRFENQPGHHKSKTPLTDKSKTPLTDVVCMDMVEHFPIDYMHQVCLGVMRKLLQCWVNGDRAHRLSAQQVLMISTRLRSLAKYVPSVFRQPRGLEELAQWKAVEFRQFSCILAKLG